MLNSQTRSKQRVADHGEVFTPSWVVNAMLDLMKQESERIDSRFLEPACGTGNFLAEVLRRKLATASAKYRNSRNGCETYELYSVIAVTSIYGVELLADNCEECRERLYDIWNTEYSAVYGETTSYDTHDAVRYILRKNIVCGDMLATTKSDGSPIIFTEWTIHSDGYCNRREYLLSDIAAEASFANHHFNDKGEFVLNVHREYPLVHFKNLLCENAILGKT